MQEGFEQYADEIQRGLTGEASATFADIAPAWETPIPFDTPILPDFPVDRLPSPLDAFVEALADSTQTPDEMAGLLALGVLAAIFQSKFTVEITPDWREPLCLYCAAVAPPGERKSAVLSALTRPIYEYEKAQKELDAVEIERNRAERAMLEKAYESAKNAAAKGNEERRAEVLDLAGQIATFKDIHPLRLLADDTTAEKLVDLMDKQGGCISVVSAEGGIFDAMRGRYERIANFDVYLKGHAGDPIVVDRIGRGTNYIQDPRLSLLLTIQPEVLTGLMADRTFRGRGLCGRFLYVLCQSKVGRRASTPPPMPGKVRADYRNFVHKALAMDCRGVIRLSPEADKLRIEYQNITERRLVDMFDDMRDWGGKLTGAAVRIAALLHAASAPGNPAETPVSRETMSAALDIAECLANHAVAVYQSTGADEEQADARYLWRRIVSTDKAEISKRDLFNICKGKFRRVEEMDETLRYLVEMGYVRESIVATGGRPSKKVEVNPYAQK